MTSCRFVIIVRIMKKIAIALAVMAAMSAAADGPQFKLGTMVKVIKGEKVIYQTPCGYTEIINPLNAKNGGNSFDGGASVDALNTITVRYWNATRTSCHFNQDSFEERIKNFPINDYELDFVRKGCGALCY